jgi:hypothetical protein
MRSALAGFEVWVRPLESFSVMLADQVTVPRSTASITWSGTTDDTDDSRGGYRGL